MSDLTNVATEESTQDQNKDLTSPEEDELLNIDCDVIETENDKFNEEEWSDEFDTTKIVETDVLEISSSTRDVEADKSIDSDDGDKSPTERGKFITERVLTPPTSDTVQTKWKKNERTEYGRGMQRNNQVYNRRMQSHYNNRNGLNNGPRPRHPHNRFRHPQGSGAPRFRPSAHFSQQPQMMHPEFNPSLPFNPMQSPMPNMEMMSSNRHFMGQHPVQQFPMYPQYVPNPGLAPFHTPYIDPNQAQMPQHIQNQMSFIPNQGNHNIPQFGNSPENMVMQSDYSMQQTQMQAPIGPPAPFNPNPSMGTNMQRTENRTVLINPHFKGVLDVQNAHLSWDAHTRKNHERQDLDDNELLRQQEEFINQNRRNLQKRMEGPPKYTQRDTPERTYRPPARVNRHSAMGNYNRRHNSRNETHNRSIDSRRNVPLPEVEPEDEETKRYRKQIEDQRKKRDLFLKQKEERRKLRMQKDESQVDSTVQDKQSVSTETDLVTKTVDEGFKEEDVYNRLNKPVHRTGVLNLRTGLIKPKDDKVDLLVDGPDLGITPLKKYCPETQINNITSVQVDKNPPNTSTTNPIEMEVSKTKDTAKSTKSCSADGSDLGKKSIEPKAGFLGRRMVIASNVSKHNIIVQAVASESPKAKSVTKTSGIFSNVVVNQEFSDEEDLLSFLDETL